MSLEYTYTAVLQLASTRNFAEMSSLGIFEESTKLNSLYFLIACTYATAGSTTAQQLEGILNTYSLMYFCETNISYQRELSVKVAA